MNDGTCRLCGKLAELQLSHVIPAFVFRWQRGTSGSGFLRKGMEPNKRVQDGAKRYWLCIECEDRLNRVETLFATRIFHPYSRGSSARFRYGPWLLKFGISVTWRILRLYQEENYLTQYPIEYLPQLQDAEAHWKDYLLGRARNPGKYELHLLPFDAIEDSTMPDMPSNINRYLMRMIEMDVAHSPSAAFIYAKLGRFMFLGFTHLEYPKQWVGTKVHGTEGLLEPRKYTTPRQLWEYIAGRAKRAATINASISERQRARIDETFRANVDKLKGSDLVHAMEQDVRMFGVQAFSPESEPEDSAGGK